jgi:hypothetical protein
MLTDITTVYRTLAALGSAIYTFQAPFKTAVGQHIVQASTILPGDQDNSNDLISDTINISTGSETINGEAEICSTSPSKAGLKATSDSSDAVLCRQPNSDNTDRIR